MLFFSLWRVFIAPQHTNKYMLDKKNKIISVYFPPLASNQYIYIERERGNLWSLYFIFLWNYNFIQRMFNWLHVTTPLINKVKDQWYFCEIITRQEESSLGLENMTMWPASWIMWTSSGGLFLINHLWNCCSLSTMSFSHTT